MAEVFQLTGGVWIFLLTVEVIDGEIQFASPASLSLGKVWYGRKGSSLTVPCVTEEKPGDKYKGAMYKWKEKGDDGKGFLAYRRSIYGNGTLTLVDLQATDTGRIDCVVSKIETSEIFVFTHSIVVYYVAEFYMINPFVYTVPSCDEILTVNKLHDLLEFACEDYRNRAVTCPFTARKDCSKKTPVEISENGEGGMYRLKIMIEQQPEKSFVVPDCSMRCMKKTIIGHLQANGDDLLRRLAEREDRSQGNLFKGFVFEKEELLNRRIKTSCFGGFELFQYILCMPCFPGSYVKYSYLFEDSKTSQGQCLPCEHGYYQEKFAMDECFRCPSMGMTLHNSTDDVRNCTTASWSIATAYYVTGGILIIAIIATCIGMCGVITQQRKREKEARRKLEEERSRIGSEASSWVDVTSTATSLVPSRQQLSSHGHTKNSINVNVNRRFSRGRRRVGASPSFVRQNRSVMSEGPPLSGRLSRSSSSESSRQPMLHKSSPAIMQSTMPGLL